MIYKHKMALFILTLFSIFATFFMFSCKSTQKQDINAAGNEANVEGAEGVSIPLPKREKLSYFSSIDKQLFKLALDSSPDSLKKMASSMYKTGVNEEAENTLLYIAYSIMEIVWPSESISWTLPSAVPPSQYPGIIDTARQGFYDSSTDNSDFFALILPSLVLFTNFSRNDYYEEAENSLKLALEEAPSSSLVNYMLGTLYYRKGDYSNSSIYLTRVLENMQNSREILYAVAQAMYKAEDYKKALDFSSQLLALNGQNINALKLCSEASAALGDYAGAEDYVMRVLQLEPENMEFVLLRAKILIHGGDYIKAASLLDVYARSGLNSKDYLLLRSLLQKEWNRNNTMAADTMNRALAQYPDDAEILLYSAKLASEANVSIGGRTALSLVASLLEQAPDNIEAKKIAVTEMNKSGQNQEAYALSKDLLEQNADDKEILCSHVEVCLTLGYIDEALDIATSLYEEDKESEALQQLYLKVLVATGRRQEAGAMITELMEGSNSKMKSFLFYQKSLLDTDSDTILSDLRSSLTANPRNRDSLYRLYRIYYNKKDWRRAQYYLKQVVALNPSDSEVLALNAELDTLLGK